MAEEEVPSDAPDAKSQASREASSAEATVSPSPAPAPVIESPPAAAQPLKESEAEPRARLHRLAGELMRNRNRRLLVEFLQLRRALR